MWLALMIILCYGSVIRYLRFERPVIYHTSSFPPAQRSQNTQKGSLVGIASVLAKMDAAWSKCTNMNSDWAHYGVCSTWVHWRESLDRATSSDVQIDEVGIFWLSLSGHHFQQTKTIPNRLQQRGRRHSYIVTFLCVLVITSCVGVIFDDTK